ncbi:uncharacterized protein LOC144653552 [Oculina patagonica]
MAETGLAFSGGGIRSAAFCSGVLRRLLQRKTKIDYLSCVSGGGYTGTAYLDWKYRHGKKDDPKWHQEFFDHMRERVGYMCNWQKPLQGIFDTIILLSLMFFVSVAMPIIVWGCNICPSAYAIDFIFGDLLRAENEACEDDTGTRAEVLVVTATNGTSRCNIEAGSNAYDRIVLFSSLAMIYLFFYLLAKRSSARFSAKFYIVSAVCGLLLAFTFIPFFIFFYFNRTPTWVQLLIFSFSIFVWFFFPVLRRKSSLVLVVYVYAYGVYWKVFRATIFGVEYSDHLFYRLLFVSGIVFWIVPALGALQQRLVYVFNRWRLQKAFYTDASIGATGCSGIGFDDIFLRWTCVSQVKRPPLAENEPGPLSLGDLRGVKPLYLSNIVVNEWRVAETDAGWKYGLLVMSPTEIERLDRRPQEQQFEDGLDPHDIDLSAAMAISAAAVARHMGAYGQSVESFKQLQIVLGLSTEAPMVSDVEGLKRENCCMRVLPFIIEGIRGLPLITFPLVYFAGGSEMWVAIGVFVFFVMLSLMAVLAVMKTGNRNPSRLEKVARWCITNLPLVRFYRDLLYVVHEGPMPPPILRLSDGGHIENLAILPLLKKRLPKIVVVDGGYKTHDSEWGDSLLNALSLARKKLHCSFIGLDGRDVIEDIKEKFVLKPQGNQPRSYRFKVHYYDKQDVHTEGTKVGEGEILLVSPRHPDKGVHTEEPVTWKEALRDIDVDLEAAKWGESPQQAADEVDSLTFGCSECCHVHGPKCQKLSKNLCGAFPQHNTANQFFTSRMFMAYHGEGYNACVEAEAAEFLGRLHDE